MIVKKEVCGQGHRSAVWLDNIGVVIRGNKSVYETSDFYSVLRGYFCRDFSVVSSVLK